MNDANHLVASRSYREKPLNQYPVYDSSGIPTSNASVDTQGWPTRFVYDWRQRPLMVQRLRMDTPH